jgi:hypothetical protein
MKASAGASAVLSGSPFSPLRRCLFAAIRLDDAVAGPTAIKPDALRGAHTRKKDRCPYGHALTTENTFRTNG